MNQFTLWGMNNNKITPKDRRDIINQAESGKFQKDIAVDYGISEAYVSKIVKGSKPQTRVTCEKFRVCSY